MAIKPFSAGAGFKPLFALHGLSASGMFLGIAQSPWTAIAGSVLVQIMIGGIVFLESALQVFGLTGVPSAGRRTDENVNVITQAPRQGLEP